MTPRRRPSQSFGRPGSKGAPAQSGDGPVFQRYDIARARLAGAVRTLVDAGWRVEAEGKLYRQAGNFSLSVTSGVDWFDLQGELDFDGVSATLPELLRALRRGDTMVRLGDGSFGMLPEEWLKKYAPLAEMGGVEGDRLRFRRTQAGLLDALLASQPEVSVDAQFAKARDELRQFTGVRPAKAPRAFRGELRPYQEAGLGWLSFLRQFGFGGCLADDMGLGKTIQVLAMLAGRPRRNARPSIVVVPKSLVWNWEQEAARFAPKLRVLAHVGAERAANATALRKRLAGVDLLVTTYGVLRKDAAFLREIEADYVILDEAQAIKNADSESAKAARLLRGDHRLALSGTPIENHLGELWSLVEFLNPGMLGTARAFAGAAGARRLEPATVATLARALRPFILRRTKEEVAPELPRKHEETILCEMEPEQRRLYDELRAHYRDSLLGKIAKDGLGKSKIQVLEALLRLRQVACHPGLVDKKRAALGSGKMDVLLARLEEVRREGHKALVFSQFTSFLALLRERLDAAKVPYEYLDGATQDRQARVTHFQTDDNCPAVPAQPEGRRRGPEPDRRRLRVHPGPLVESSRRSAGRGPRPPDRARKARVRLPPVVPRQRRGEGRGPAGDQARSRRLDHRGRRQRHAEAGQGDAGIAAGVGKPTGLFFAGLPARVGRWSLRVTTTAPLPRQTRSASSSPSGWSRGRFSSWRSKPSGP